ncbi:uncharacterized protein LOC115881541 isoform X1 [Sitophilus oryzae]|uniref:Uncharacterized protein LOC115881541 isoform X1 n=1 Tax=Sitophilus oryzae TaxID=7048 RepID=A0A6J2XWE3_SITOR|nr:uncharacterized protein LOC115881541 isoform X1 [Sitophilus oryzae]
MSKRKPKEFVGARQKSRRALIASQQFAQNILQDKDSCKDTVANNLSEYAQVDSNTFNIIPNCDNSTSSLEIVQSQTLNNTDCSDTSSISNSPSSSISDQDDSHQENTKLCQQLVEWATVKHKITHSALTDLLHILSPYHPELPLDSRTLLATPNSTDIVTLETGQFCYFGLKNVISKIVSNSSINGEIQLCFNVDGIPLFKSSKSQLWPILCSIKNIPCSNPFTVAVFCGKSKPKPLNTFLKPFIEELNTFLQNGFINGSNEYVEIKVHSFICDAPARAYLKCTKSHTGYSSCDKCTVRGEYYMNKVVLDSLISQKRTDEAFRQQLDEDHHIAQTPLTELPIDLIKSFPIDYMHNICLGIVKKLLNTWIGGPLKVRLPSQKVKIISERLLDLKTHIPVEFNRKPRSLDELQYWKATEFRMFLIYLGPLVLKDLVDIAIYENFLAFHFSISILLSKKHIKQFGVLFVKDIINVFIQHLKTIYGKEFIIYNVHLLSHICDDVEIFGVLDNFSAFPFENYLGQLKSLVKAPTNPLQQIHRRLVERDLLISKINIEFNHLKLLLEHSRGPLPVLNKQIKYHKQFGKIIFHETTLSVITQAKADCYCLCQNDKGNNKVIEIHNIIKASDNEIYLIGKEFLYYSDLYSYPYPSSELSIYVVNNLSDLKIWSITRIIGKCVVLPFKEKGFVAFPIIHSI